MNFSGLQNSTGSELCNSADLGLKNSEFVKAVSDTVLDTINSV